jgi:hypothetical protein
MMPGGACAGGAGQLLGPRYLIMGDAEVPAVLLADP